MSDGLTQLNTFLSTPELPELGPGPRKGIRPLRELNSELDRSLSPVNNSELVRTLILLWHDHLDAAHRIAQEIETTDGSYVHGIMHRREPDYSNAKYWFRRVGRHACFAPLAGEAAKILKSGDYSELRERLIRGDEWDAFAFVDACEQASHGPTAKEKILREIQAAEFKVLLEHLAK